MYIIIPGNANGYKGLYSYIQAVFSPINDAIVKKIALPVIFYYYSEPILLHLQASGRLKNIYEMEYIREEDEVSTVHIINPPRHHRSFIYQADSSKNGFGYH
jgi:hypothetical protein